jgi:hypothetical protein
MSISGITDYYKNLDNYLQANSSHIQRQFENERASAGYDLIFDASNRGSFRSLNDETNDGYISDDEREEMAKKRLVIW